MDSELKEMREFNDLLQDLKTSAGQVGAAAKEAMTPLANAVFPKLTNALSGLAKALQSIGKASSAFATVSQSARVTEKTVTRTSKALSRTLADFDQIQRLSGTGESQTYTQTVSVPAGLETIRTYTKDIESFFDRLPSFDLEPLQQAFGRLKAQIQEVSGVISGGLGRGYDNVLVPLAAWAIEDAAPAGVNALTAALGCLKAVLSPLQTGFASLWESLRPIVQWVEEKVIVVLNQMEYMLNTVKNTVENHSTEITGIFTNLSTVISSVWTLLEPVLDAMSEKWSTVFRVMQGVTGNTVGGILTMLSGITEFLAGVFTLDVQKALNGIATVLKVPLNAIIGMVNTLLLKTVVGLNDFIKLVNKASFKIPDWGIFGSYAGKSWGPNLSQLTLPKMIPYLAQGAVLPANRPFLAMVGDQRNGTNVEAPLSTIQEAVAAVMDDQTGALTAGFEACVEMQREILQAVLGIRIGDEVIGNAVNRYNRKNAMMKGGCL